MYYIQIHYTFLVWDPDPDETAIWSKNSIVGKITSVTLVLAYRTNTIHCPANTAYALKYAIPYHYDQLYGGAAMAFSHDKIICQDPESAKTRNGSTLPWGTLLRNGRSRVTIEETNPKAR